MFVECLSVKCLQCIRQINFSTLRNCGSFLKYGSQAYVFKHFYDNCLLRSILKWQVPTQVRYFVSEFMKPLIKICRSLRDEDIAFERNKKAKKLRSSREKNDVKIMVTLENGNISAMFLSEAEKYAKRNNLSLVRLDNLNYQFVKGKYSFIEKKTEKDNLKKFIIRDSIADHDLQIKIDSMLKYVERKGVSCIVENVCNKLDEMNKKIKDSALGEFVVGESKSTKRLILTLRKKDSTTKKNIKTTTNNPSITCQSNEIKNEQ